MTVMAEFSDELRQVFDVKRLVFRIGEIASMTGVSARQLRYWEQKGLIQSQERPDEKQARVYTFKTFIQVSMIKYFMDEGLTLAAAAKRAGDRQTRAQQIHRFVTRGLQGLLQIDGEMALNLGAFDAEQTLLAILPDEGGVHYRLLPNAEVRHLMAATPN